MRKSFNLQLFAAPTNMTGKAQIQARAREIDFVTTFGKNIQALLDVLGITRMIKKGNGSVLKTKKVTGTLQSGAVAEGDEIPMSRYTVEEEVFDTISIEKYRKGVSVEAIADKGYEVAVQDTDEEFKSDLQNKVYNKFYTMLKSGSLTGYESTWQMAVAMAIGKVKKKFMDMKRTPTGIAVWANVLDVYKYVGGASITIQKAFGLEYIKDFLGADIVFITSEVPQDTVVATPLNNIVAYYVDPADSDFAKAGLEYTTDPATGFIGFHTKGTYERAISEMFAIMGIRLFCEYLDAIAHIAVGQAATQTLGALTISTAAGSSSGKTKISVAEQVIAIGNRFKYKAAEAATTVTYGMSVATGWTEWDGESEIATTSGYYVTVVECGSDNKAVRTGNVAAVVNSGA